MREWEVGSLFHREETEGRSLRHCSKVGLLSIPPDRQTQDPFGIPRVSGHGLDILI